jgi:predicted acylesterase/phospholipase RssA
MASPNRLGLVLGGGASFGAWEVGALQALWNVWNEKHPGESPPVSVVAGSSTGALIAPFALLDRRHIDQVSAWYRKVRAKDIVSFNLATLLPTVLFLKLGSALAHCDPLRRNYKLALKGDPSDPMDTLEACAAAWPAGRLAIATIDFGVGASDGVTNSPEDTAGGDLYESRLFQGIFASAIAPLMGPPVSLAAGGPGGDVTPHFDGGVCSETPFDQLFAVAGREPAIPLTHVVAINSYPLFPGRPGPASPQHDPFPNDPCFGDTGVRFDSLLSEAESTKDIRLARAALKLRGLGVSRSDVETLTGLSIADPVPQALIEAVPQERMGWNNSVYDPASMGVMESLGLSEATAIFRQPPPAGLP